MRRPAAWSVALPLLALVVACGGGGDGEPVSRDPAATIRFASYDFPENQILAEIYAEAAQRVGLPVSVQHGVGTREVVAPALQQGVVDVVVDYLGTALTFVRPTEVDQSRDPVEMHAALSRTMGGRGVAVLDFAQAEDQNGFAVTTAFGAEHGVGSLSDLKDLAPELTFGAPPECPERPLCLPGLERVYGLEFERVLSMPSRAATVQELVAGQIDVGLIETTDGQLLVEPIMLLVDDLHLQPPENVVPLVRSQVLDRWGDKLSAALNEVSGRLTTNDLVGLNAQVADGLTPAEAAARWWGD